MRTLLLVLTLTAAASLPAQTFRASVLAGGNFSQIDGDDLFGYHQLGVNAGVRVVALLGDRWRVGPEILFSQQGARRNRNSLNISPFNRIDLTTLEVPLMVYYQDWRLTAEMGLSYANLFDFRVVNDREEDVTATTPLNSDLLAFKAGVTFFVSANVGVNFRYSRHLTDIDPDDSLNTSFRGRWLSLRLVYTFGRGETLPKPSNE